MVEERAGRFYFECGCVLRFIGEAPHKTFIVDACPKAEACEVVQWCTDQSLRLGHPVIKRSVP